MSLYRKYRPLNFSSLLGQGHVCEILKAALSKERVSHAYLFTGPRGTGKTSTARMLARAINCLDIQEDGPCNKCDICQASLDERLTDLVEIDAASHGLVDDARALVEQAKFMPVQARRKIYIIDEVHMLSKSAFNALLKIIEEPPDHVHFILATTEAHKVLDTVKSRCQRFDFHLADSDLITEHLKDVCSAEGVYPVDEALQLIARHARGSFRDALSLLDQVISIPKFGVEEVTEILGLSDDTSVLQFVQCLILGNVQTALSIISELHSQGHDLYQFCQAILTRFREELLNPDSENLQIIRWVEIFYEALDHLRNPVIPELPLEIAVLKALKNVSTISSETMTTDAQANKKFSSHPSSPVPTSSVPKDPLPVPDDDFKSESFIASITQVPLRTLLKYVQFEMSQRGLSIRARSQFELDKIKERSNRDILIDSLKSFLGDIPPLHFGLISDRSVDPSQSGDHDSHGTPSKDLIL